MHSATSLKIIQTGMTSIKTKTKTKTRIKTRTGPKTRTGIRGCWLPTQVHGSASKYTTHQALLFLKSSLHVCNSRCTIMFTHAFVPGVDISLERDLDLKAAWDSILQFIEYKDTRINTRAKYFKYIKSFNNEQNRPDCSVFVPRRTPRYAFVTVLPGKRFRIIAFVSLLSYHCFRIIALVPVFWYQCFHESTLDTLV